MTDKIQELEDAVFSHHLLQDHDKINQGDTQSLYKGVIEPDNSYVLDSIDVMGHRSPLYLRSLIEALGYPAQIRQKQATNMLQTTKTLLCEQLGIQESDYPFMEISQTGHFTLKDVELWRSPIQEQYNTLTSQDIELSLPSGLVMSLSKFEKQPISQPSLVSTLELLYQCKITKLYLEQHFFKVRITELTKMISEVFQVTTQGLYLQLPDSFENDKIHYYLDENAKKWLLFPVAITRQQLLDIKEIVGAI